MFSRVVYGRQLVKFELFLNLLFRLPDLGVSSTLFSLFLPCYVLKLLINVDTVVIILFVLAVLSKLHCFQTFNGNLYSIRVCVF